MVVEEEEVEEVMPERLQTACLYLLRCVQSVGSLGGSVSSWKHGDYFSTAEEWILQAVPGEYLAPMIHVAFIGWPDRILSPD